MQIARCEVGHIDAQFLGMGWQNKFKDEMRNEWASLPTTSK
jgi:hypothetical protein